MPKINYVKLDQQWSREKKDILNILDKVISKGMHVGGEEVDKFEQNIKNKFNVKYCLTLNSGTDALVLALHAIGVKKNDEVITVSNSFIASTSSIVHLGAKPIFVDIDNSLNINPYLIEKKITPKTKAIMPVHLTGRCSDMKIIKKISKKYKIPVIEDAAQSIGSKIYNRFSGTFGDIGCFSTHPLKNLNAIGDGGFIITNSLNIYKKIKLLRNHGLKNRNRVSHFGYVSRMDTIQAAILSYRLKKLDSIIIQRRKNASIYLKSLKNLPIILPEEKNFEFNTYHTFVIVCNDRDKLKKYLENKNIETAIHYPIPIHKQSAFINKYPKKISLPITEDFSNKILTLPVHQFLSKKEIRYICDCIKTFYQN